MVRGGAAYLTRKHRRAVYNVTGTDVVLADERWCRQKKTLTRNSSGPPLEVPIDQPERMVGPFRDWMPQQSNDISRRASDAPGVRAWR